MDISIHAPARGATAALHIRRQQGRQFQSTLPRGERLAFVLFMVYRALFQSTLPRGERQKNARKSF